MFLQNQTQFVTATYHKSLVPFSLLLSLLPIGIDLQLDGLIVSSNLRGLLLLAPMVQVGLYVRIDCLIERRHIVEFAEVSLAVKLVHGIVFHLYLVLDLVPVLLGHHRISAG